MASVIWIDSDDEGDFIEILESPISRQPLAGPSKIANTPKPKDTKKRQREQSPDCEIIEATPRASKIYRPQQLQAEDDDHAIALALQRKWEEEDELVRKRAAETDEKSFRLIARLQKMDEDMAEKRRKLAEQKDVPDDGIVFKVLIDAEGNTIEGDDDPDNAAHLEIVKRDFEQALAGGLKVKTVQWFVNAKLEARFEAAKEVLNSFGIDTTEKNLFHGTAVTNIQPILQNGFLIPGVTPGINMAHGAACGVGIYLATNSSTSMAYTQGATRMFMCRVLTGRSTGQVSHEVPRPLGQNGYESWSGPGNGVYVVKYVDLVVPRYVVEFESNAALYNYGIMPPMLPMAGPARLPALPGGGGLFGAPPALAVAPPFGGRMPPPLLGLPLAPPPFNGGLFGLPPAVVPPVVVPPATRSRRTVKPKSEAGTKGKGKAKAKQKVGLE